MALHTEENRIKSQLDDALSTCRANGIKANEAEVEYRIKKAQEILRLKSEGYPATLIPDIVKGLNEVAILYQKKLDAEVVYKANCEAILVKKLELKIVHDDLKGEYENDN